MPYLESLSTGQLLELAGQAKLDIPPGLERIFIIEELIYNDGEQDDPGGDAADMDHMDFTVAVALPEHYHMSFVDVLIRDPLWAFVLWEIKAHDRELHENAVDFEGYCLRVIPLIADGSRSDSFTVTIDVHDTARYVGFPPDEGRRFKIELCAQAAEQCTVLAVSRPFTLPRLIKPKPLNAEIQAAYRSSLAQLSGVDRFSLVHSTDREQRSRDFQRM